MTNLTTLYRAKCEDHLRLTLNITYEGEHSESNRNQSYSTEMKSGVCNLPISYETLESEDDHILLAITLEEVVQFPWRIRRDGNRRSLLNTFSVQVVNLTIVGQELSLIQKKALVDITTSTFRFSIYVPLQSKPSQLEAPGFRVLYAEEFYLPESGSRDFVNEEKVQEIESHKNEGCQIFGHLFIKRIPGNLYIGFQGHDRLAAYLANRFSLSHTVNLFELTDEKEELTLGQFIPSTNPIDGRV